LSPEKRADLFTAAEKCLAAMVYVLYCKLMINDVSRRSPRSGRFRHVFCIWTDGRLFVLINL